MTELMFFALDSNDLGHFNLANMYMSTYYETGTRRVLGRKVASCGGRSCRYLCLIDSPAS